MKKQEYRKQGNQGFTLVELLIVVAIIAVLAAIAIPIMNQRLESSREAADISNIRSAYALAMTTALTGNYSTDATYYYDGVNGKLVTEPTSECSNYLQGTAVNGGEDKTLPGGFSYSAGTAYKGGGVSFGINDTSITMNVSGKSVDIKYDTN